MLWPIKNAEKFNKGELKDFAAVGVEVVDDHTLRLRLERPSPTSRSSPPTAPGSRCTALRSKSSAGPRIAPTPGRAPET
jgi:hypothetical protein